MSFTNRIASNWIQFKNRKREIEGDSCFSYLHYWFLRIRYGVGVDDYFNNRLWDSSINHDAYYYGLHTYIHKWSFVNERFSPTRNRAWLLFHYVDYLIAKIYCPGLDAMDYFRYQFYEILPSKRRTFITEGGVSKMVKQFNGSREGMKMANTFKSKKEFNTLFSDVIKRKWIEIKSTNEEQFVSFCSDLSKVICKPIDGGGGKGIFIYDTSSKEKIISLYKEMSDTNYLIEEIVVQHDNIAKLNPSSVNTIRVYSVFYRGEVMVTSATLRIGNGPGVTDNYSSGGLAAEIDVKDGVVVSRAVSQSGESYYVHPYTNIPIIGTMIPDWGNVKKVVVNSHKKVPQLGYIGWDVVVCNDGSVTFLEANTCAGVELQQHPCLIGKRKIYSKFL